MADMVERVAQAIWEAFNGPWSCCPEEARDTCRGEAKAAIEAMRPRLAAEADEGGAALRPITEIMTEKEIRHAVRDALLNPDPSRAGRTEIGFWVSELEAIGRRDIVDDEARRIEREKRGIFDSAEHPAQEPRHD